MNFAYTAYYLLSTLLFFLFLTCFRIYSGITGRRNKIMNQRLGFYPSGLKDGITGTPRIWIHASSVGEVGVAEAIVESLTISMPHCAIILSVSTRHGHAHAKTKLPSKVTCIHAPLDFTPSVKRALTTFKPHILVCLETEIWPNWLITAHKMGIKTAIVNGRISVRSINKYLKIRPLIREVLKHVDLFSMINETDAERIARLGALKGKIEINGNAKYDLLLEQADSSRKENVKKRFNLNGHEPVFLAGSTRSAEEEIILEAYHGILRSVPDTILIIAPRHVSRTPDIEALVKASGFAYELITDLDKKKEQRSAPVVILNTIGELQATYSIASIVFCGGSLVPLGGQNILEAAVWGIPVFYGPSMEDFLDAKELLEKTGGGIQIKNGQDLAEKAIYYLNHQEEALRVGKLAKKAVISNKGAAGKHALAIERLLAK